MRVSSVLKEEVRAAAAEEDEKSGEAAGRETLRDEIDPSGKLARAARRLVAVVVVVVAAVIIAANIVVCCVLQRPCATRVFDTRAKRHKEEIRGETRSVPWRPTVFFYGKSGGSSRRGGKEE